MALLKFKRSAVPAKVPALNDLALGELAINTYDGKVYTKKDNGTASIVEVGGGGGVTSFNTRTGAVTLSGSDVTTALGYTPYNATNPAGYITGITSGNVTTALGYTPANKAGDTFTGGVYSAGQIRAAGWWGDVSASATGLGVEIGESGGRSYVISYSRDVATYGPMSFEATDFTFTGVSGGFIGANTSVRAPIFYDSNDTSYYVDPNSNSNFIVVYASEFYNRGWFRTNDSDKGLYNQATGQHWYSDNGNFWNMGGGNLNGQGIRFRDNHQGTVRGYVYYDQSNNVGFLNQDGNWRARVVGGDYFLADGSSARAQIFYDSNDTAYYINGAGDSVLNTLYLRNGSIQAKFAQASNFGYSSSYRTVVLGNEYLTTISMGVDVSGNASGSFNGQGEGREVLFRNGVTFVTPNSANTGYLPTFNMTDGYVTSGGSVRSPIFYDSDNTGYYVDPASTSVLGGIVLNGALDVRDSNPQYWRSTNGAYQRVDTRTEATSLSRAHWYGVSSSGGTSNFRHAWYDNAAYFNVTAQDGEIIFERTAGETIVRSTGSFRAPAFYDSNDTAYYIDPNGNSTVNNLYAGGGLFVLYNSVGDKVDGSPWYGMGGTTSGTVQVAGYYGLRLRTASSIVDLVGDYAQANNSFRAPIFYDSNNTAHYVDPNATSVMTTVYARKNSANNSPAIEVRGGNPGYPRIQTYGLDADAGAWMGLGTDMAGGPYEHSIYFPYGNANNGRLSIGDYSGTTYNPRLWVFTGYTQINNSTRSPLFYDSDNTGYYVDAASTSNLRGLTLTDGSASMTFSSTSSGRSGAFGMTDSYNMYLNAPTNGVLYLSSFQAPIMYDRDNSAYYVDPHSTTNINVLNVAGNIVAAGNVTAYSDIRIKANVETIPSALDKLDQIRGVTYTRIDLDDKEQRYAGVIAQEIEAVLPEAVRDLGNIKAVDYNATIALLIEAVKELSLKVKTLEEKDN